MSELPIIHLELPITQADREYLEGRATLIGPGDDTLGQAEAAVVGVEHHWDAERFARFPNLKTVCRAGIGYDNVDIAAAHAAGVVICNAPDSPTVSTAEHAWALLLTVTKELPRLAARSREGLLGPGEAATSLELDGRTLGLVGMGRIARRVARVGLAFDMRVIACDPFVDESPVNGVELVELNTIWSDSDVVSLHAPSTPETYQMVNADVLASMKRGVYIVNAARGPLIDHEALVAALERGHVAGVGLDVMDPEPLPVGHSLLGRDDVVVTPHIASSTSVGRRRLFEHAYENALAVLAGQPASVITL